MCGILFQLHPRPPQTTNPTCQSQLEALIRARGPDGYQSIEKTVTTASSEIHLTFSASVLALRGSSTVQQPLVDEASGCVFMWNGEAWKFDGDVVTQNDTRVVFEALVRGRVEREDAVRTVLERVTGPFAFLFYDAMAQKVYYARDKLGRRSLVRSRSMDGRVCVASVSDAEPEAMWEEIPVGGVYSINILQAKEGFVLEETFSPWSSSAQEFSSCLNRDLDIPKSIPFPSAVVLAELEFRLQDSMSLRTAITAPWLGSSNGNTPFAVLFSGGIDCTLLAYMLDKALPADDTIDLLNVAFENPRVVAAASKQGNKSIPDAADSDSAYDACPDRRTGLSSYNELSRICPHRKWQFVAVNVPYTDTSTTSPLIAALMYPHSTEMDLSISLALFFASKGKGEIQVPHGVTQYTTPAKVLFSGLGADELFGGYTRHTKAFAYSGLEGLLDELDLDFHRLGQRNLGRDDRVVSHTGREIRYPYLDEDFSAWALRLPIWEKCGFGNEPNNADALLDPGKLVLRMLAVKLGLKAAAAEKKRAIQFGARTAKMTAGKTKGTDAIVV